MGSFNDEQPPPTKNERTPVWELVIADVEPLLALFTKDETRDRLREDMRERNENGIAKYGTPLQPFNGRDALVDAYQEALDLCVYLRQYIEERRSGMPEGYDNQLMRVLGWYQNALILAATIRDQILLEQGKGA